MCDGDVVCDGRMGVAKYLRQLEHYSCLLL